MDESDSTTTVQTNDDDCEGDLDFMPSHFGVRARVVSDDPLNLLHGYGELSVGGVTEVELWYVPLLARTSGGVVVGVKLSTQIVAFHAD